MNTEEIIEGYLGNTQVDSIYQGSELVWPNYFNNKYMIGGSFTSYSPNDNLLEDKKDSISIVQTYNDSNYEYPPFNGSRNNIVVTLDNSTQINPEFSVMKINRLNSNVIQADYVEFPTYNIEPGKTMEMGFWYYGTYGTVINMYSLDEEVYIARWGVNAYITNNSRYCEVPVTTNTWQYIKVRVTNTHKYLSKKGIQWLKLHDDFPRPRLSNTEYWKITCVKLWHVESVAKNKIIRLNYDGSIDDTWYNNDSYYIQGGTFYELKYDNINRKVYAYIGGAIYSDSSLVRLNLDGTKDTSFNIGTGFNHIIRNIIIDNTNSKIYAVGRFTTFQGNTQNRLARLNMDGSLDTSFNIGTGFNGHVCDFILVNNKLYVGGEFTTYNGISVNRIVCLNLDATINTDFNVGTGFNNYVYALNIDTINQKLYVGGNFTTYNGSTQNRLVRLNMDGSLDTSFNIGTGFNQGHTFNDGTGTGIYHGVLAINIDTINQKIYVGGNFYEYNGTTQNRLIRLNMDGSKDNTFNIGTGLDVYIKVPSGILIDNERNKIYIAGFFTKYNNQPQKYIARLNMNGSLDNTFNIQLNNAAHTILKYKI